MQSYWKKSGLIYRGVFIVSILLLTSCASKKTVVIERPPPMPPEIGKTEEEPPPGSLFNGRDNLFSDDKARNVGDILTIKVVENVSGSGSATSQSGRDTSVNLNFPSPVLMGKQVPNKTPIASVNASSGNQFKGQGKTGRNANLIATITARVVKVYPNGNLFIVGEKVIKINNDEQVLRISGIVKPSYIQPDNSIYSFQISDMKVEYNGKGFIADQQQPGWLARFLIKIWPF
ncbi:MAG: flagellar basal body L-ring protein FlgH [Aquificota bacterium]|nr:MAG: flagellar basal body L-ring protein FlgH [Aquificota bacterium]